MIAVTINGQRHELDIEPETPLLWVLRDELGLTGTNTVAASRNAGPAPCI